MTSSADIKAGAAYVELYVNDSALVRGLKSAQKKLHGFSESVTRLGKRMMALSGALASPFMGGVKVFADFEKEMANVSTMLDQPEKYMDTFKDAIREMSVEFGESTETLASGLYDILSASIPAEKALDVLAVSAKAAKAGLTDTGTAADAITTMLNAYGLSADKAGDVSDWLFSVVKRGKTTFAELAPSVGLVATTAASAGVSLDELGAALATMTRNGVKTENAITAVTAIISAFLKPGAEAAKYAKSLGFEMSAATLKAEGFQGIFEKISQLPPDTISKLFPNVRALRGVLPALQNMEGFAKDIAVMKNRTGAAETAYRKMSKTLAMNLARLKEAGLAVLDVLGEALADKVSKAAKSIVRFAGSVEAVIRKNKSLVISIAKSVVVIGSLGAAFITVGVAAKVMATAFNGLSTLMTILTTTINVAGGALAALLSPMGLVIAAAAALTAGLLAFTNTGGKALSWLGEQFSKLKAVAVESFRGIGDALAAGDIALAGKILWLSLKLIFQKGINTLYKLWIDLKASTLSVWIDITTALEKLWQDLWFALKEIAIRTGIAEPILKTFNSLESGWLSVTQFFSRAWLEACRGILETWNRVTKAIKTAQNWIAEKVVGVMAFFDSSIDEEAVKKAVRAQFDTEKDSLDKEMQDLERGYDQELGEMKRKNQTDEQSLKKDQSDRLAELHRQESIGNQGRLSETRKAKSDIDLKKQEEKNALEKQSAADLSESAQALKKAREEWQAAIAQASEKRNNQTNNPASAGKPNPQETLRGKIKSAGRATQAALGKIDVRGTFNTMSLRALGAAGASDAVASNTAEMVKEQKKTNRKLDEMQDSDETTFE